MKTGLLPCCGSWIQRAVTMAALLWVVTSQFTASSVIAQSVPLKDALAWGRNDFGQCNVPPLPPSVGWKKVAAGFQHSVGLKTNGQIVAWGNNQYGQCNVPILPSGVIYVDIESAYDHNLALRSDGTVVAWGLTQPPRTGPAQTSHSG
jgi:alpha-tubulin suppressor-like RCC1 family protein